MNEEFVNQGRGQACQASDWNKCDDYLIISENEDVARAKIMMDLDSVTFWSQTTIAYRKRSSEYIYLSIYPLAGFSTVMRQYDKRNVRPLCEHQKLHKKNVWIQ